MRNKKAKRLRKDVMLKMYVGDDVTEQDVRKGKHDVMKSIDFKRVYRARKRNESAPPKQRVKHMESGGGYDHEMKRMHDVRLNRKK
jgi:hypothetical protein